MVLIIIKPTQLPPPHAVLKTTLKIGAMLLISQNLSAQVANTFTATNVKVMDTLTSVNVVKAHEIVATETITAKDDIVAEHDIRITGALTVTSTATFKSTINADQGINFGGNSGMRFLGTNSAGQSFLRIGENTNSLLVPPPTPICPTPSSNYWWMQNYGGYISSQTNGQVNASLSMFTAPWDGNGHTEVQGLNNSGQENNALSINYFCGRDAYLCTNTGLPNGGGKVVVGNFLQARQHVEIGDPIWGIEPNNSPATNVALDLHVNTGKAIKARTYNGGLSMFEIENYGNNQTSTIFKVFGDGRLRMGNTNTTPNAYLSITANGNYNGIEVIGTGGNRDFLVSNIGHVFAPEIRVKAGTIPDYVFESNYKLRTLKEVEDFYKLYKHLPKVPSEKEILANNLNLGDMSTTLLKKVEELTIYLVEQNKQLEIAKKEIETLKQQIKK